MKEKVIEKNKAIGLRERGCSMNQIAKELNVSVSSVSKWVKHIILTNEQKQRLSNRNPIYNSNDGIYMGSNKGSIAKRDKHINIRKQYQKQGCDETNGEPLHIIGCMLYWAEGHKSNNKNTVKFTNMDVKMLNIFLDFIKRYYTIDNSKIKINIHTASHTNKNIDDMKKYWINELDLKEENIGSISIDKREVTNKKYHSDYNGVCSIIINSTEILQRIYGSIKKYINIDDEDLWIY